MLAQASTHIEVGCVYPSKRTYEVCASLPKQAHINRLRVSAQARLHIYSLRVLTKASTHIEVLCFAKRNQKLRLRLCVRLRTQAHI